MILTAPCTADTILAKDQWTDIQGCSLYLQPGIWLLIGQVQLRNEMDTSNTAVIKIWNQTDKVELVAAECSMFNQHQIPVPISTPIIIPYPKAVALVGRSYKLGQGNFVAKRNGDYDFDGGTLGTYLHAIRVD